MGHRKQSAGSGPAAGARRARQRACMTRAVTQITSAPTSHLLPKRRSPQDGARTWELHGGDTELDAATGPPRPAATTPAPCSLPCTLGKRVGLITALSWVWLPLAQRYLQLCTLHRHRGQRRRAPVRALSVLGGPKGSLGVTLRGKRVGQACRGAMSPDRAANAVHCGHARCQLCAPPAIMQPRGESLEAPSPAS